MQIKKVSIVKLLISLLILFSLAFLLYQVTKPGDINFQDSFQSLLGKNTRISKVRIWGVYIKDKFNNTSESIITEITNKSDIDRIITELKKDNISKYESNGTVKGGFDNESVILRKDKLVVVRVDIVYTSSGLNSAMLILEKDLSKNYFTVFLDGYQRNRVENHIAGIYICNNPKFFDFLENLYYKAKQ